MGGFFILGTNEAEWLHKSLGRSPRDCGTTTRVGWRAQRAGTGGPGTPGTP